MPSSAGHAPLKCPACGGNDIMASKPQWLVENALAHFFQFGWYRCRACRNRFSRRLVSAGGELTPSAGNHPVTLAESSPSSPFTVNRKMLIGMVALFGVVFVIALLIIWKLAPAAGR